MAVVIDDKMIEYIGALAELELSGEEKIKAAEDMGQMLLYIDMLNELHTEGIDPMSHACGLQNVFREDEVTNGDMSEQMLANAPQKKEMQFIVPKTVER